MSTSNVFPLKLFASHYTGSILHDIPSFPLFYVLFESITKSTLQTALLTNHIYTLLFFEIFILYYVIYRVPTADVSVMYTDMCGLGCPIFRTVQKVIHNQIKLDEAFSYRMSLSLKQESAR